MSTPATKEISDWLEKLGMSEHTQRFAENDIDSSVLPHLTDENLKELGLSLGHRVKLLAAIRALGGTLTTVEPTATPAEPKPQDAAERRQVTVLFSDMVGSTALSARMDPEDFREIISAYQKCVTETVRRFGGFVAKYMGDGVLVYFGYPQAHEDDAERAVRAGLELVEAMPKLTTAAGVPLQVRVGIATGLVVVGDLIGVGAAQEQAVVGETPNIAARLQALAKPGAVVIAGSTRRLTGGLFEYRDLGTVALKGFAENVPAWQVLGASAAESRFEALRATTTPLVGRDEEVDLLLRRWAQAKRGDGCVVLISGEPGIGKSRIAESIVERISAEPHTRLRYFCSPHHQDSALYPSITQLERAAGFRREDSPEQRLSKLEAVLAQGTNNLSEAVPMLADLLSIPTGDRYPALNLTPQKRKEKTLHAQLAQVEGLAARQPVLVVYEDFHWSDPTTRESLDLMVDRVPSLRVLVILTFRPEFIPPWIGRAHVTMLTLNRLPPRQRAEMIAYVTGGKVLPREITDQIIDRTDGVPLFIEELTKTVVESGMLTESGGGYAVTGPPTPLAIPATLHASLLARLDRLAPTREVAQIGAALGRKFSHELISAVAQMPQQQIDGALAQLTGAELIFRRGTPPDAEYTFKHALVQDAAYGTMLHSRRRQLHSRITTTLETQFPVIRGAQPELLARHCTEAGLTEKAVGYWLKAGRKAVAHSAMKEAVGQLKRGLELLTSLPDNVWRRRQELDLRIALARALIATEGLAAPVVGETYVQARALAEQLDRTDYLVPLLVGECNFRVFRAEWILVLSLAEQIDKMGGARNDGAALLISNFMRGIAHFNLGEFVSARTLLEQCLSSPAYRSVIAAMTAEDPHVGMLVWLGVTLAHLGYVEQGRGWVKEAMSEVRRLDHAYTVAVALTFAWWVEWVASSPNEARRRAEELTALSNEHGFPVWLGWGLIQHGWSLTALGQAQEGLALLTRGLPMLRATGAITSTPLALMLLADTYAKLGQPVEGLDCVAEATQIVATTDERYIEAELYRLRGDLLNDAGDRAAAEQNYHQALAVAKRQSAKVFELRATTSLARLWRDHGKRTEARELLAPIYGWFTEGLDTPVLQEAKVLLEQLNN